MTPRQLLFSGYLLAGHGVTEAGRLAGVSWRTAYRWAKQPTVRAEIERQLGELQDQLGRQLPAATGLALDRLLGTFGRARTDSRCEWLVGSRRRTPRSIVCRTRSGAERWSIGRSAMSSLRSTGLSPRCRRRIEPVSVRLSPPS